MTSSLHGGRPGQPRRAQPPPLAELTEQFEALLAANQAKLTEMARQNMAVDPMDFLHARIDHLINTIAGAAGPDGARWALMTRLSFEQHTAAQLAEAEAQGRKADLAIGASFTPGQIADLARASGMFRARR